MAKVSAKSFTMICATTALLISFSSCNPEEPPPKDKKLNWTDDGKVVNTMDVKCHDPGNECSYDYEDIRGKTPYYNEFLSYYKDDKVIEYFQSDERWEQLFPQYRSEYAYLRAGILNGTIRIFVSGNHTVIFYTNELKPENVLHAFQF